MRGLAATALVTSLAGQAFAGDFSLIPPIDCALGEDQRCYIQHFVDRDPGPSARDFMCQGITYDTHKGTDFALRSWREMQEGVAVVAAASGVVTSTRDGMIDKEFDPETDTARINGRDCGNGLVIAHGKGWETQYCHLRQGSVRVKRGDRVSAGTSLGLVGMSGRASFPHIHLSVRKDGETIDPYAPNSETTCGKQNDPLWDAPPPYQSGALISVGFSNDVPSYETIKAGNAHSMQISADSAALVLWGFAFGSQSGDMLRLEIKGPDKSVVFARDVEIPRAQAQFFRAGGRKTQNADWFVPGEYTGVVTMLRDGTPISDMTTRLTVLPN